MLDSESQLREAIAKLSAGDKPDAPSTAVPVAGTTSSAAAAPAAQSNEAPRPVTPELSALATATADAAAALGADDLAGYQHACTVVNEALRGWLAVEGGAGIPLAALPQSADLKAAREAFEPFSTAVTDLARQAHIERTAGLHAFECTMAPSTGHARWLQRTAEIKNPFYGSAMPNCGDEMK
jgi:Cu(I)/Ag(I) efflux system membrane fusion protein